MIFALNSLNTCSWWQIIAAHGISAATTYILRLIWDHHYQTLTCKAARDAKMLFQPRPCASFALIEEAEEIAY